MTFIKLNTYLLVLLSCIYYLNYNVTVGNKYGTYQLILIFKDLDTLFIVFNVIAIIKL